MSIYTALRKIWYGRAGAAMICLRNLVRDLQRVKTWFLLRAKFSRREIYPNIFFKASSSCVSKPNRCSTKTRWFQSLMVEKLSRTYHGGQRLRITMNIWFYFFFFLKMLSFVKYPYIAAPSCHLYSDLSSPPYCLWVSDSSSLPVTARRLDFELALFTPSSVVVVVVVALRQTSRCNGKPRLSLNRRLQRSLVMFFSESVLEGRFCRLSARTGEKIWVDLLTHICLF